MAFIGRQYAPLFSNKYDDMMIIPDICNFFRYALSAPPFGVDNTDIAPPFGVDKTKTAPPCIIMSTQGKDRYIDRFYILMHQLGGETYKAEIRPWITLIYMVTEPKMVALYIFRWVYTSGTSRWAVSSLPMFAMYILIV